MIKEFLKDAEFLFVISFIFNLLLMFGLAFAIDEYDRAQNEIESLEEKIEIQAALIEYLED